MFLISLSVSCRLCQTSWWSECNQFTDCWCFVIKASNWAVLGVKRWQSTESRAHSLRDYPLQIGQSKFKFHVWDSDIRQRTPTLLLWILSDIFELKEERIESWWGWCTLRICLLRIQWVVLGKHGYSGLFLTQSCTLPLWYGHTMADRRGDFIVGIELIRHV